jgi:hypothetical protein
VAVNTPTVMYAIGAASSVTKSRSSVGASAK